VRVNPLVKQTLSEIARESVQHHNSAEQGRWIRRLMRVYHTRLTEQEQVYVAFALLELLHYRNLSVDPENMLTIANVRLRTYFFVFLAMIVLMVVAAVLFKTNHHLTTLTGVLLRFFKIFAL
jgi:hypothetical protein